MRTCVAPAGVAPETTHAHACRVVAAGAPARWSARQVERPVCCARDQIAHGTPTHKRDANLLTQTAVTAKRSTASGQMANPTASMRSDFAKCLRVFTTRCSHHTTARALPRNALKQASAQHCERLALRELSTQSLPQHSYSRWPLLCSCCLHRAVPLLRAAALGAAPVGVSRKALRQVRRRS